MFWEGGDVNKVFYFISATISKFQLNIRIFELTWQNRETMIEDPRHRRAMTHQVTESDHQNLLVAFYGMHVLPGTNSSLAQF